MVKLLLGLDAVPAPHDAADALAVAICHLHAGARAATARSLVSKGTPKSWRQYRPRA
jgi:Holliday junction resolvasome RuvABC endonuclease subunit